MIHTFEVWVDIKEYIEQTNNPLRSGATRYEVDAESRLRADSMARSLARADYPRATEYDVRVTRLLK
jgi:hypothetical protein